MMAWNWKILGNDRRRTLTSGDKKYLLLQARGKCEYCGGEITSKGIKEEIHHIVPFASRGSDNYHNLIVLCPNCHSKAEHISREAFRLKIVQERLGHASIRLTLDTYSHVTPGLQQAAAESFDKLVNNRYENIGVGKLLVANYNYG